MARGWESKSVESQIESAREQTSHGRRDLTREEKERQRARQGLLLARTYVLRQLEASSSERYKETLQQALNEIDQKLAKLDGQI